MGSVPHSRCQPTRDTSESYTPARNDRYLKPREAGHRRGRVWARATFLPRRKTSSERSARANNDIYTYLRTYTCIYTSLGYRKRAETSAPGRAVGSKTIRPRRISRSIRSLGPQSRSRYCTQFILRFSPSGERRSGVLFPRANARNRRSTTTRTKAIVDNSRVGDDCEYNFYIFFPPLPVKYRTFFSYRARLRDEKDKSRKYLRREDITSLTKGFSKPSFLLPACNTREQDDVPLGLIVSHIVLSVTRV